LALSPDYEDPADADGDNVYEVEVTASDGAGGETTQTVRVSVSDVNEAPRGADGVRSILEDTPYPLVLADFGFADEDAGDSLQAVRIDTLPLAGVLTLDGVEVVAGQRVAVSDILASRLVFRPVPEASGESYAGFTFSVQDAFGVYAESASALRVDVMAVNDAPVAGADSAVVSAGAPVTLALLANDQDVDDALGSVTLVVVEGPRHGTLEVHADGTVTYRYTGGGDGTDAFRYVVRDPSGAESTPATVSLVVEGVAEEEVPRDEGEGGGSGPSPQEPGGESGGEALQPVVDEGGGPGSPGGPTVDRLGGGGGAEPVAAGEEGAGAEEAGAAGEVPPEGDPGAGTSSDQESRSNRLAVGGGSSPRPGGVPTLAEARLLGGFQLRALVLEEGLELAAREGGVPELRVAMEELLKGLDDADPERGALPELVAAVGKGAGVGLSAGFVTWLLRGGSLVACVVSSIPIWKGFDPLPVVGGATREERARWAARRRPRGEPPAEPLDEADEIFERERGAEQGEGRKDGRARVRHRRASR
jgi:hypothetical protein